MDGDFPLNEKKYIFMFMVHTSVYICTCTANILPSLSKECFCNESGMFCSDDYEDQVHSVSFDADIAMEVTNYWASYSEKNAAQRILHMSRCNSHHGYAS